MTECTLLEILDAREDRVRRREALQKKKRCPVLSLTMNIAGAVKDTPLIRRAFHACLDVLWEEFREASASDPELMYRKTGPELLWALRVPARELKAYCIDLEEGDPSGRVLDLDVYDETGRAVSRTDLGAPERSCIVCGAPGRACAAGQKHSVEEVRAEAERRMREAFFRRDPVVFAEMAMASLIMEAGATPKPGLVDTRNSGSHKDMDFGLMAKSAEALSPCFEDCVRAGVRSASEAPEETFSQLRRLGIRAEKTMYRATGGVNTHKGAIYLFGIALGALGRLWQADHFPTPEEMLFEGGRIASDAVEKDFQAIRSLPEKKLTAGQRIYLEYGLKGARGEAAEGFPSVREVALPYLRAHEKEDCKYQHALLHLIALGKDTNMIARGGYETAQESVGEVRALLKKGEPDMKTIEALDERFIGKNLSPGGSADLLALSMFCRLMRQYTEKEFA